MTKKLRDFRHGGTVANHPGREAVTEEMCGDPGWCAYLRLGELLRSAHVVEQILDRLSPHEQLAVCGLWAREPVAQPTVFERLRRFSTEPELADDVRLIVAALAEDPRLRPWLQGYQLVGDRPTRQNVSG